MKIGLTYDLRSQYLAEGYSEEETAEFDRDETIEAIDRSLVELGFQTDRIGHARQLVQRLAAGDRWDLVFNICEGLRGTAREAQVPALLEVYEIPYTFSDPVVLGVCLDKALTKTVLRAAGLPTPDFAVIRRETDLERVSLTYPQFAKPLAEGTGKGITPASRIRTAADRAAVVRHLLRTFRQPVLLETYLPGREFTVGVWGTGDEAEAVGTMEIVLRAEAEPGVYSYVNKEHSEQLVDYPAVSRDDPVVIAAEELSVAAWQALGCRDAGRIDLRCDERGQPQLMEVNPLAGLHPAHSDLPMICTTQGIPFGRLIERIVRSASARCAAVRGSAGPCCQRESSPCA